LEAFQDMETALAVVLSTARPPGAVGAIGSALPSHGLPLSVHAVGLAKVPEVLASKPTDAVVPGASGGVPRQVGHRVGVAAGAERAVPQAGDMLVGRQGELERPAVQRHGHGVG